MATECNRLEAKDEFKSSVRHQRVPLYAKWASARGFAFVAAFEKTANLGLLAALLSVDGYGTDIWASVVGILVSVF